MPSIPVFCSKDCGGNACPLLAVVEDGRVTRITHNPAGGKFLKGCVRGHDLPKTHYAPDRLLKPLVRSGPRGSGQFREASWEEALTITADKLGEITARYGPSAILNLSSAGDTGAFHSTYDQTARFLSFLGGGTRLHGSYSNAAACFVMPYLLGADWKRAGHDAATLPDARMIVLWGSNLLETRQGSEMPARLIEAHRQGTQIVVIDPRHSATVKQAADWWLPVRPGADAALMLAVLYVLLDEGLVDRPFIADHSLGFAELEAYTLGLNGGVAHTAAWAEERCGIPAEEITRFARAYAAARPAMLLPGYSIQRVTAGEETFRLTVALQIATGNFGRRGGSTGGLNSRLPAPRVGTLPVPATPDAPIYPVLRWPDVVLDQGTIHAIYSVGGNYLNQGGQVRKAIAAFEKVDFAVAHELFLTPTARFCDVVFPTASPLEKEDIGLPWLGNYLLYKPQILPARGETRTDYHIFCGLADRLGFLDGFSEGRTPAEWIQRFLDASEVTDQAEFRRTGLYWGADQARVGLADFAADPLRHPLQTPSGKVELASADYQRDTGFPAIPTWREPPVEAGFPLRLVTPKSPRHTHSQGWNLGEDPGQAPLLEMRPEDAAPRGLSEGDGARIYNAHGALPVTVHLTSDLALGVVSLLEGRWVQVGSSTADELSGSPNLLTSSAGTLPSSGAVMHGVPVEVAPQG